MAGEPRFSIVPAHRRHVPGIVRCHAAAFPGQFLTLLGPGFLKAYYDFYVSAPGAINLVAEGTGGAVLGFVSGGEPGLRGDFTRRHVPRFAATILRRAAQDGRVRRRLGVHLKGAAAAILRRLGWPVPPSDEPPMDPPGTWSVLLSIGVLPDAGGLGIGRALMEGFRRASADRGYRCMHLSVHNDNAAAIGLYRASGWKVIATTPGGTYFRRDVAD